MVHEGKNLEFFQTDQVFRYACFGAHLDVMKFAFDKGLGIDNEFACIKIIAGNGNIDCWNFLMDNGFDKFLSKANIEYANRQYHQSLNAETPTSILNYAAHMGQYDMVNLLLEYGIKPNTTTLINAVAANVSKYEQLEMVKTLFEHGALISKSAMKLAVENCRLRTFQYLTNELKARNQGKADGAYPGKDWLSEEDFEFMEQLEEWSKITQSEPFRYCCDLNPQLWKNRDVRDRTDFIVKLLEKEGFKSHINITMAFPAALLFEDDQSLFRYLKKHGQVGKLSLIHI